MAPRRKSQADSTTVAVPVMEAVEEDDMNNVVGAGEEEAIHTATVIAPSKPISTITKQQKDAASGADGIDQYELARTQVTKVAKGAVPENIQLRKEVILGLIKSSTVFISYLASAALDKTHEAGNKTLSATHVINAFKEMGFPEEYAIQLKREYNEKVKLEAERTKANKAAKADAARAEEQSMEIDAEQDGNLEHADDIRVLGDESIAVDLNKEGAEEESEDVEEEEEAEAEEEEEDVAEEDEEEEEVEGMEGGLGDREEPLPSTD